MLLKGSLKISKNLDLEMHNTAYIRTIIIKKNSIVTYTVAVPIKGYILETRDIFV